MTSTGAGARVVSRTGVRMGGERARTSGRRPLAEGVWTAAAPRSGAPMAPGPVTREVQATTPRAGTVPAAPRGSRAPTAPTPRGVCGRCPWATPARAAVVGSIRPSRPHHRSPGGERARLRPMRPSRSRGGAPSARLGRGRADCPPPPPPPPRGAPPGGGRPEGLPRVGARAIPAGCAPRPRRVLLARGPAPAASQPQAASPTAAATSPRPQPGLAYDAMPAKSSRTQGWSPTVQASCPGGIETTSPGPRSTSAPSSITTRWYPEIT